MPVGDDLLRFAGGSAISLNTSGPGEYALTTGAANLIDLDGLADPGQIGSTAHPLYWVVICSTTITAGGSGELELRLSTDATTTFSATSSTLHVTTPRLNAAGTINAGTVLTCVSLPFSQAAPYERYLGITQNTIASAMTAGAIQTFLTRSPQLYTNYADAEPNAV